MFLTQHALCRKVVHAFVQQLTRSFYYFILIYYFFWARLHFLFRNSRGALILLTKLTFGTGGNSRSGCYATLLENCGLYPIGETEKIVLPRLVFVLLLYLIRSTIHIFQMQIREN